MLLGRVYFGDVLPAHVARIDGERSAIDAALREEMLVVGLGRSPAHPQRWNAVAVEAAGGMGAVRSVRAWLREKRPDVVHAHTLWSMLASAVARVGMRPRPVLVYEIHGAVAFEARMRRPGPGGWLRFAVLYALESAAILLADRLLLVSDGIERYYPVARARLRRAIPRVVPGDDGTPSREAGAAAHAAQRFAADARARGRKVVVYSGGLSDWQMFDATADFLRECVERAGAAALVLTSEPAAARAALAATGLGGDDVHVASLPNEDVAGVLRACDVGLLFRHDDVVNRVASPTKFFEYLAAGLHVVTTPGAATIAQIVRDHELGVVCAPEHLDEAVTWVAQVDRSAPEAARIRAVVRDRFTWRSHADALHELYER